jgi:hypothetical protein
MVSKGIKKCLSNPSIEKTILFISVVNPHHLNAEYSNLKHLDLKNSVMQKVFLHRNKTFCINFSCHGKNQAV